MKIYIINLNRNPERKQFMSEQLKNLPIESEFIQAVDGQNLPAKWQKRVGTSQFYNQVTGNAGFASVNEIACFASHYLCWEKCAELGKNVLVLEDDVLLRPGFATALNYLEQLVKQLDYVRLMVLERERAKTVISEHLYLYTDFPCGAQGYVITPKAAARLIRYARKFHSPVDMYLDRWYLHGLRAYCVNPELIKDEDMGSSIGVRKKIYLPKPSGFTKLVRELVRPVQKIRALIVGSLNPIVTASSLPPYPVNGLNEG